MLLPKSFCGFCSRSKANANMFPMKLRGVQASSLSCLCFCHPHVILPIAHQDQARGDPTTSLPPVCAIRVLSPCMAVQPQAGHPSIQRLSCSDSSGPAASDSRRCTSCHAPPFKANTSLPCKGTGWLAVVSLGIFPGCATKEVVLVLLKGLLHCLEQTSWAHPWLVGMPAATQRWFVLTDNELHN